MEVGAKTPACNVSIGSCRIKSKSSQGHLILSTHCKLELAEVDRVRLSVSSLRRPIADSSSQQERETVTWRARVLTTIMDAINKLIEGKIVGAKPAELAKRALSPRG